MQKELMKLRHEIEGGGREVIVGYEGEGIDLGLQGLGVEDLDPELSWPGWLNGGCMRFEQKD